MRYYDTYEQETLATLNTRTGVKKNTANYSSYWLDFDDEEYSSSSSMSDVMASSDPERIIKLASVRRAIANFVRILTNNEKIEVMFSSGKDSYTDGQKVVIAAEDDSKQFDPMVGLALHEGAHCLLSDFNLTKNLLNRKEWYKAAAAISPELRKMTVGNYSNELGDKYFQNTKEQIQSYQSVIGLIMNVIEDRRIDSFVYKNAAGYRPYYDAMYNKYFFNTDVTKNLRYNREWRIPTVQNYINWLINIFHPDFNRNALPGLSKMVDMIDLKNIRRFDVEKRMPELLSDWPVDSTMRTPWADYYLTHPQYSSTYSPYFEWNKHCPGMIDYSKLPLLWTVSNDIMLLIVQYVANYQEELNSQKGDNSEKIMIDIDGTSFEVDSNTLPNLDMGTQTAVVSEKKFNAKKADSWVKKMEKVMNGENRRKKLNKKEKQDIQNLENADAKLVEAGDTIVGKFPCLVTRKLTKQIMESDVFPFSYSTLTKHKQNEEAVIAGIRMGQILAHRLAVRNDPTITHFTRQERGKIDRRILSQLGMDIENVFKRTTVDNYKPVMIHLSLDASGSMGGKKWYKTMTVATALAYVASKISNVEVVITIRGDSTIPIVSVIYDSRKDNFQKVRTLFPCIYPMGSTPEGLCFSATLDIITESVKDYDTYFINFSDGEPGTSVRRGNEYKSYSGQPAYQHTRRMINSIKEAGVKVLSYFITEGVSTHRSSYIGNGSQIAFKTMYGEDAVFVNVENVTEVLRTLNKLLLKKVA